MDSKQILITVFVAIWLLMALVVIVALPVWLRGIRGGAAIPIAKVIAMRFQGLKVSVIVDEYTRARKEGAEVSVDEIALMWRTSPRTFQADVQSLIEAKKAVTK